MQEDYSTRDGGDFFIGLMIAVAFSVLGALTVYALV